MNLTNSQFDKLSPFTKSNGKKTENVSVRVSKVCKKERNLENRFSADKDQKELNHYLNRKNIQPEMSLLQTFFGS